MSTVKINVNSHNTESKNTGKEREGETTDKDNYVILNQNDWSNMLGLLESGRSAIVRP